MGHLKEMRNRAIIIGVFLLIGVVVGWFLYQPVIGLLQSPLHELAEQDGKEAQVNFASVASPFDIRLKVAAFIGVIASSPIWLYQIFAFIMPGLKRKEKLYTLGFVLTALPMFLLGGTMAFFALPNAVKALGSFIPEGGSYIIPAGDYLSFVMLVILAFGVAFILPVLMVGLNMLTILSAHTIRKSWRWLVVLVFVFAAIATPSPDAVSMFYLVVPMLVMFFLAWLICALHDKRRRRRMIAEGTWVEPVTVDED
ncbi:twin-arginine translocase subunit TatC [Brevibacterium sp. 50QC2O2]|uniref:twin-arginine translocase subunit TatC n=1 Tax=Brevibacterium TaxID=1696 RepID=UPI00211B9BCA|nr:MULTISPECIES: twin-arginine translocase subunit TatC [unclassified Brevibacterium]MCQ9366809.1 twin-arginine translocase subunit TatC [Brevibacterium sp. 91QC2O2]MCQ9383959.1 twin-arginine translocase subunit TatC [Brevibacterium sp. 68QC2CO]MCQ9388838.1 twin-arginine translocase subunit TatC [Brevibacterium sp. 50QC2O2]